MSQKEISECIGLWLAEGDDKTHREITFTNNSFELIEFFDKILSDLFKNSNLRKRIYVYCPNPERPEVKILGANVKYYTDSRANKPYFMWRVASVELCEKWRAISKQIQTDKENYPAILRGFFAGEGNIKTGSHGSRAIRIAQKHQLELIDQILNHYKIRFHFSKRERAYVITGKENWDTWARLNLADLHPEKKTRFWKAYNSFKQTHYPKQYIRERMLIMLEKPKTSNELAKHFLRSQARLQDVLIQLKREGKINNFRVGSVDYWTSKKDLVIISARKRQILHLIGSERNVANIAKILHVGRKSISNRLAELDKLGLASKNNNVWQVKDWKGEILTLQPSSRALTRLAETEKQLFLGCQEAPSSVRS
ncbi:MAG TPA: hypothetical protein VGQ00_03315 [Candidatus Norongarragalinales archaeon]|jgi:hypothetical protein|nr:hypothetical protein [Candidatus Norongarragalinales archaeon]